MGGRFGKYGDLKRKERLRKTRLGPPGLQQRGKDKPPKGSRRRKNSTRERLQTYQALGEKLEK